MVIQFLAGLLLILTRFFQPPIDNSFYWIQTGTPRAVPNFVQPEKGCNFGGVAGQVYAENGEPAVGLLVHVFGEVDDQSLDVYAITGSSLQMGEGGFDLTLFDHPVDLQQGLTVELLDFEGMRLSNPIKVPAFADCNKNLTIINFVQIQGIHKIQIPFVAK